MTEQDGGFIQDADLGSAGESEATGGNPAWQELYQVLPTSLHPIVDPVLQKWESGSQQRIQQYAEQMKAYEPYAPLVDAGVPLDRIEQALQVAQLIDSDPYGFLQQMQTFFPDRNQQQQESQEDYEQDETFREERFDLNADPNFRKIQEQQDLIAQVLTQQIEAEKAKQEDEALDVELNRLTQQYGEFDEDYVFGLALNGIELEDAVQRYFEKINTIRSQPRADANIPSIVSPGGGMPSEVFDPANMSDAERKQFVIQYLAQANNQGP